MNGRSGGSGRDRRYLLVFFSALRSGPARRMDSLLAQLARKERKRLSVTRVDVEERPELAKRFKVRQVPTLVLVKGKRAVARLEGRANAAEIEELVEQHVRRCENRQRVSTRKVRTTIDGRSVHAQARNRRFRARRGRPHGRGRRGARRPGAGQGGNNFRANLNGLQRGGRSGAGASTGSVRRPATRTCGPTIHYTLDYEDFEAAEGHLLRAHPLRPARCARGSQRIPVRRRRQAGVHADATVTSRATSTRPTSSGRTSRGSRRVRWTSSCRDAQGLHVRERPHDARPAG